MNFLKLKSGEYINPNLVTWMSPYEDGTRYQLANDTNERFNFERISIEDFQNLLRGPAVTPLVSHIVNLDDVKPGKPCQFTHETGVKHGIIDRLEVTDYGDIAIRITSDGERYTIIPPQ
jgi:hypothetical protein